MRITIKNDEVSKLLLLLDKVVEGKEIYEDEKAYLKSFREYLSKEFIKPIPKSKRLATIKARQIREDETKQRILKAVERLNDEGRDITNSSLARFAGVAYNTAKRYKRLYNL